MVPRTRRQHTADTGPMAMIPDASTHTASSKKKAKSTKMHRTLPQLVIKKSHVLVPVGSEVTGKHTLSPEEGPTINTEMRAKPGSEETRPPLELLPTDDEVETTSQAASRLVMPGNVPPNRVRKLKQKNHCSHSSGLEGSEGSSPEVSEDDKPNGIAGFTQMSVMTQKMAFEASTRPSWLANTTEDSVQHQTVCSSVLPPSIPSSREDIDLESEDEANLEFTGAASEGQQMTHVHAEHPQDDISDFSGRCVDIDAVSEGLQVMRVHPKGSSKGTGCTSGNQQRADRTSSQGHRGAHTPSSRQRGAQHFLEVKRLHAPLPMIDKGPQATSLGFKTTLPAISDDSVHPRHTEVPQVWPKNTDLYFNASGNIKLTHQTSIVQATITKVFGFLHASIMLENSYPDTVLTSKFIQDALSTAALHIPDAEDVHVCVLKDYPYCVKMSILPCAWISIFRSEVKEHCVAAIALLLGAHESATVISGLVLKLQTDFNFIFPRRLNNANNNVLIGSPNTTPSPVPISRGNQWRCDLGGSEGDGRLVSTAFYAALHEWETGERKSHDFTANAFMEAYSTHIASLGNIETKHNTSYHSMMAEIYQLAVIECLQQPFTDTREIGHQSHIFTIF
ncbi:hypothetical protein V8E53_008285 [Lactarius tabidus]